MLRTKITALETDVESRRELYAKAKKTIEETEAAKDVAEANMKRLLDEVSIPLSFFILYFSFDCVRIVHKRGLFETSRKN